ncbi:MAG: DUF1573 domain-containing protein [Bacteroidales bacterium]|nr:DUF1573 domain-containing protein [Bacteroidales bacterium]
MKKTFLLMLAGLFSGIYLSAQVQQSDVNRAPRDQKPPVPAQEVVVNPNAPDIVFEKVEHDYGTIYQNDDGSCEFSFTNKGKEPLILSNVRSSCGCTVPEWPRQPILPGESEVIKVRYDTKRIGIINKTVTVMSNAKTASVVLKIKGSVIARPADQVPEQKIEGTGAPINK